MTPEVQKIKTTQQVMRFNVLVAVYFKVVLSRDVMQQLSLVDTRRRFRGTCFLQQEAEDSPER